MQRKNLESQPQTEESKEEIFGSENINDWEQDEQGVFQLKEEVRKIQSGEMDKQKLKKEKRKLEKAFEPESKEEKDESRSQESQKNRENEEEPAKETIEDRINDAVGIGDLVAIFKPLQKGRGVTLGWPNSKRLNIGWFGGRFGGEPIESIVSHLEEIQMVMENTGHRKWKTSYAERPHIVDQFDYIPEKSGLKKKVKEILERQQKFDESEFEEKENVASVREKILEKSGEEFKKTYLENFKEIEKLVEEGNNLMRKIADASVELKKWEFLMNAEKGNEEEPLEELEPEINKMVVQLFQKSEQKFTDLKFQMAELIKKLDERGFSQYGATIKTMDFYTPEK